MKKLFFSFLVWGAAALTACSGNSKSETADSADVDTTIIAEAAAAVVEPQDTGLLIQTIREIYENRPADVLTPEFKEAIEAADKKEGGEMGYFDYDILTNSQHPGDLKDIELVEFKPNGIAIVKVIGVSEKPVVVTAKLIDGGYYIDDVENYEGNSTKEVARQFVNGK